MEMVSVRVAVGWVARPARRVTIAAALVVTVLGSSASAWQTIIDSPKQQEDPNESDAASSVAVDSQQNVLVTGRLADLTSGSAQETDFVVMKLQGADGKEIWRTQFDELGSNEAAFSLVVTPADDPVAMGKIGPWIAVVKLSGATGAQVWRNNLGTIQFSPTQLVLDSSGDLFAAARISNPSTEIHVVRLGGNDGVEQWRRVIVGPSGQVLGPSELALDGSGNVLVGAQVDFDFFVAKLAGVDGSVLWEYRITSNGQAFDVTVDASGDVVASGRIGGSNNEAIVVKLDGATGAEQWRYDGGPGNLLTLVVDGAHVLGVGWAEDGSEDNLLLVKLQLSDGAEVWRWELGPGDGLDSSGGNVIADGAGNVVVAGRVDLREGDSDALVATYRISDGAELWRRTISGTARDDDGAGGLAIDAAGDVVAAGRVVNAGRFDDLLVVKFNAGLPGRRLIVKDKDPARRKIALRADDLVVPPSPGSPGDPTIAGAQLEIANPITGESDTFDLPAVNWRGLGDPPGHKGYKYSDRSLAAGPCKKVEMTTGKRVKAVCRGDQIGFSLDEPTQGALGVTLSTDALPHCLVFGGIIVKDEPGLFRSKAAPVPSACVDVGSPSGAFMRLGSGALE